MTEEFDCSTDLVYLRWSKLPNYTTIPLCEVVSEQRGVTINKKALLEENKIVLMVPKDGEIQEVEYSRTEFKAMLESKLTVDLGKRRTFPNGKQKEIMDLGSIKSFALQPAQCARTEDVSRLINKK